MKRILAAAAAVFALAGQAKAADNYQATEGAGKFFGCKDIGGVCYPQWIPTDSAGAAFGVTGNPFFVVFPSAQAVTATLAAETTKVIGTVNQGTSPWVVSLPGSATAALQTTGNTSLASILAALGSPFQAGGSIGNTTFAATQGGTWTMQPGNTANTTPWAFNQTQINGVAYLAGNGATGTGSPRITIANDNTVPTGWPTSANQTAAKTLAGGTANIGNVGGTSNVTPTDCSGTVTSGGTAQNAIATSSTRRGATIVNLSTDPMWISFTGTAAIGAAGSYLLAAGSTTVQGGSFTTPLGFGFNTALSLIAATTGDKFSCTQW